MLKFIMKRIFEAIPTMLVLITISFFLMRFAPGNPFSSERPLPPEVMANIEAKYGLDKPVFEQYTTYLLNVVQGDFGPSFKYLDYSVNELISVALPVSANVLVPVIASVQSAIEKKSNSTLNEPQSVQMNGKAASTNQMATNP